LATPQAPPVIGAGLSVEHGVAGAQLGVTTDQVPMVHVNCVRHAGRTSLPYVHEVPSLHAAVVSGGTGGQPEDGRVQATPEHVPVSQSVPALHVCPTWHWGQVAPPQSVSVSSPFWILSSQVSQIPFAQSRVQTAPSTQFPVASHDRGVSPSHDRVPGEQGTQAPSRHAGWFVGHPVVFVLLHSEHAPL
jgi:hypothetical protein